MTHIASLVTQGVFDKFPALRVMVVGGGITWLPGLLWRFDLNYKTLRREVPWLRATPSTYVREHISVGTHRLSGPASTEEMERFLTSCPELKEMVCYASAFPDLDCQLAESVAGLIPADWRRDIFYE